jgi:hypothetical protein
MTAPRGGSAAWGAMVRGLSERDIAILHDLARVRCLTGRHIERLHFRDGSSLTSSRKSRSTLQRLTDLGLLTRAGRQVGGIRAGSSGWTYGLSVAGQKLTNGRGPAGGVRLRKPWDPLPGFIDHVLSVAELYVQLREAEHRGELELLDFVAEPPCWRTWTGPGGERLILKPDAFVRIGVGDYEHVSFIEVDRSTESTNVLARKVATYTAYWQSGVEQESEGLFPRSVWLVPDEHRLSRLLGVLGGLPPEAQALFRAVLFEQALDALSGRAPPAQGRRTA